MDDNESTGSLFEWRGEVRGDSAPYKPRYKNKKSTKPRVQSCKKCGLAGHYAKTCGKPRLEDMGPGRYSATGRTTICTNCGIEGHNRMTCKNERNPDYVPPRYTPQHSGRTRCSRCGDSNHNAQRCTGSDITRADRICVGCGVVRKHSKADDALHMCKMCMVAARRRKPRHCAHCSTEFTPGKHRGKVCSEPCRRDLISASNKGRFLSLQNERYGSWLVIDHTIAAKCVCRCDCGAVVAISSQAIRDGNASVACKRCLPRIRLSKLAHLTTEERIERERALSRESDLAHEARKGVVYRREVRGDGWIAEVKKAINAVKDSIIDQGRPRSVTIAKCDLVCSNCHRVRTFARGQHMSYVPDSK